MSNKKLSTREIIVGKAISMYNEYGVEYVGVRELAKELDMKGGNITYYFPTKYDLIKEIVSRLSTRNTDIFMENPPTLAEMLEAYERSYKNQYQYRGLFNSIPLLLKQNKEFFDQYQFRQRTRKKMVKTQLLHLIKIGYIKKITDDETDTIMQNISLLSRFWISEATADGIVDSETKVIRHYVKRLAGLMYPVATTKGKKDIETFLGK
jgi:AcrR family transcriptional regulator